VPLFLHKLGYLSDGCPAVAVVPDKRCGFVQAVSFMVRKIINEELVRQLLNNQIVLTSFCWWHIVFTLIQF
jgi:hypothetical protein